MKWTISGSSNLDEFLGILSDGRQTFALERSENGTYRLAQADTWQPGLHTLGEYRQTEPLKALFFPAREYVGRWGEPAERESMPERIVFGVKNCDLSSLAIFDHVFLNGVARDPYYAEARDKTILVSTDCSSQLDVCFCPAVGEQPHARQGFDINIAETPGGFVIEAGSERGRELLGQQTSFWNQPAKN